MTDLNLTQLASDIRRWGQELGFQQLGITDIDLDKYRPYLEKWLAGNFHGEMDYMARHHDLRCNPDKLLPGK